MKPLPWQQQQWDRLLARHAQGRLPHALLLRGQKGLGKKQFALALAAFVLCEAPQHSSGACGQCKSCRLLAAGNHPEALVIEPVEAGKAIAVDQIRAIGKFLSLVPQQSRWKTVIIDPADAMNMHAANSLLKNLEEPTPNTVLMLVSHRSARLAATIRSRCQNVEFAVPDHARAAAWVAARGNVESATASQLVTLAQGAPLLALVMGENGALAARAGVFDTFSSLLLGKTDALSAAKSWLSLDVTQVLGLLTFWYADMIKLKMAGQDAAIAHGDLRNPLQVLAKRLDLRELFRRYDAVRNTLVMREHPVNEQLLLEGLLIPWQPGNRV